MMSEGILLQYTGVQLNREENIILRDVDLKVNRGDFLYIIGKVGSGKSTLLKSMYAEIPIEKGDARVFDYRLQDLKRKEIPYLRRKIGIVFQDFQLRSTVRLRRTWSLYSGPPAGKRREPSVTVSMRFWCRLACRTRLKMPHELREVNSSAL